jgi:integrase
MARAAKTQRRAKRKQTRGIHKLSTLAVSRAKAFGYYGDGGGLYLRVGPTGAKSWAFRFKEGGKGHEMGLGPLHAISLAEARDKARGLRRARLDGVNPIDARREERRRKAVERMTAKTMRECGDAYVDAHAAEWRPSQAHQWRQTLRDFVYPRIGELHVAQVDTPAVLSILQPIWGTKTVTASRVRERLEAVIDYAVAAGYRPPGDNPARWSGLLEHTLAKPRKVAPIRHHAALDYREAGAFMAALRGYDLIQARALEFCILTASRIGEAVGARWLEIDLVNGVWTVPPERMKAGKEHKVPLSDAAVAILKSLPRANDYVFPSPRRPGQPIKKNAAAHDILHRRMGREGVTTHGFRATFRTWAGETTAYPREVIEMALAHRVGDATEQAYARGDLFDRRRRLMDDWAKFCATPAAVTGAKVVAIRR